MSKAYDRVEWQFLEAIMARMGFDRLWIKMIMVCVSSVSYSIAVNGNVVGKIFPSRGLRQDDPISPYLFIICAEAFSSLLSNAQLKGLITGVPTSKKGPSISHLFFADDSVVFCKANKVEWRRIMNIIEIYERGSGQRINVKKTAVFFSRNTCVYRRKEIIELSGLVEANRYDTYLGLPFLVGKNRNVAFNNIKEKVLRKLNNWKSRLLSLAGKEVLLKAVVQAIPTYSMSVFLLPASLCRELNQLMQVFWWGHLCKASKIHWMSWSRMGRAKSAGGLGFRDLTLFNKALLAKQCWRLIQFPNSLSSRILKAKYFPNSSFLEAELGKRPSFMWRSFMAAKDLISSGILWRVGDGRSINIWGENWVPNIGSLNFQPGLSLTKDAKVSDLIDASVKGWNSGLIDESFPAFVANAIKNIPLCPLFPPDKIIWNGTSTGSFTVKSAYHLASELLIQKSGECSSFSDNHVFWKKIWAINVPNASKFFLWRACQNILPTKQNLLKKGVGNDDLCPCCMVEVESVIHVLWCCPGAQDVWGCGPVFLQKCPSFFSDFKELISYLLSKLNDDLMCLSVLILHRIWLRRNKMIFEGLFSHPMKVCSEASRHFDDFKRHNSRELLVMAATSVESNSSKIWKPPNTTSFKVNWDASLNINSELVGIGCVLRDRDGVVIAAKCCVCKAVVDPVCAEAMAALVALDFCSDLGVNNIECEGDSLQIIKGVSSTDYTLDRIGHFLDAIKQKAASFLVCNWSHCFREANEVAHLLARRASFRCCSNVWVEDMPLFISSVSFRDQMVSRL